MLPKLNCSFNTILIKIPENILLSVIKFILKFIWKNAGLRIAKTF